MYYYNKSHVITMSAELSMIKHFNQSNQKHAIFTMLPHQQLLITKQGSQAISKSLLGGNG